MLLEAAKKVLRQNGYAGLSTRDVAAAAGVPLSQIHYHFGSKQGMVLALFEYLNAQLLDRQNALFGDTTLKLSEQWDRACDYLDDDIASGYVRVLQELIAASWSNPRSPRSSAPGSWDGSISSPTSRARPSGSSAASARSRPRRSRSRRQRVHRRGKPLSARSREEGRAGAPGAAARRRSHSHRGKSFIDEVTSCVRSCPTRKGLSNATA